MTEELADLRKTIVVGDRSIDYAMDPIKIGRAFDVGLELIEIAAPILNASDESLIAQAFTDVATKMMKKGGYQYIVRLFTIANLRRNGILVDSETKFSLAFSGKGGLVEVMKVTEWVLKENFEDFFTEMLGSFQRLFQPPKDGQAEDQTAEMILKGLSQSQ